MMVDSLAGRRTLLTGATGFIGRAVVAQLERAGAEIHAIARHGHPSDQAIEWHPGELDDTGVIRQIVASTRPEVIIHLAGETRAARDLALVGPAFDANLASTVNLLTAAAETTPPPRVLIAGSLEEPAPNEPTSSPYAASKAGARMYADLFRETFGLEVGVLRVFMVYGPGQRDLGKLVPHVVLSLLRGEGPRLTSGIRQVDWIYVDDVAAAFLAAATAGDATSLSVDVGSGEAVSIRTLVERIAVLAGSAIEPEFGAIPDRPQEQIRIADVAAAERAIGWRPAVPLDEGLRRTMAWCRELLDRNSP